MIAASTQSYRGRSGSWTGGANSQRQTSTSELQFRARKAPVCNTGRQICACLGQQCIIVDVVTVRDGFAKAHPGAVKGLIQAWFRAVGYLQAHPEEGLAIIGESFSLGQREAGDMLSGVRFLTPSADEQFLKRSEER